MWKNAVKILAVYANMPLVGYVGGTLGVKITAGEIILSVPREPISKLHFGLLVLEFGNILEKQLKIEGFASRWGRRFSELCDAVYDCAA